MENYFYQKLKHDYGIRYWYIIILKITGPNPPFASDVYGSRLVTSPTTKGVILIGGSINHQTSDLLYELAGDSEDNLTWSLLDQKLDTARFNHMSLPVPNDCVPLK